jgi:hypothetical protein
MGMKRLKIVAAALSLLAIATTVTARQLKTPSDWKWRLDAGEIVEAEVLKANETRFVAMPPGWHVTTGPGALLYHPDYLTKDTQNFAVEAEIFLFEGTSQEEYGVFIAGKNLSASERPSYLAFVGRRDGQGMIRRGSGEPIVPWKTNDAILPHPGKDTVKNILRVEAGARDVVFSANGKEVARVPRAGLSLEGAVGFRFGTDLNIHASRLDVTYKLAPVPAGR